MAPPIFPGGAFDLGEMNHAPNLPEAEVLTGRPVRTQDDTLGKRRCRRGSPMREEGTAIPQSGTEEGNPHDTHCSCTGPGQFHVWR